MSDYAGAYVKLRFSATAEDARVINPAKLRQVLLDAGAHNAWVEPTIVREARARVEGLDETLTDREALALWVTANVDEGRRAEVLDVGSGYLEGVV